MHSFTKNSRSTPLRCLSAACSAFNSEYCDGWSRVIDSDVFADRDAATRMCAVLHFLNGFSRYRSNRRWFTEVIFWISLHERSLLASYILFNWGQCVINVVHVEDLVKLKIIILDGYMSKTLINVKHYWMKLSQSFARYSSAPGMKVDFQTFECTQDSVHSISH